MTILPALEGETKLRTWGIVPERNLVRKTSSRDGPELDGGSGVEIWDSFEHFRTERD